MEREITVYDTATRTTRVEKRPAAPPNRGPDPNAECECGLDDSPNGLRTGWVCPKHDGTFYA